MQVNQLTWHLRSPRCECCSGQGALCFSTCPECGAVVLVCDEVGTVYLELGNFDEGVYGGLDDPSCVCPVCRTVEVNRFRSSKSAEIQARGYDVSQYE